MNRFSVLSLLILSIFLGSLNVEGYDVSFRLSDANSKSYRKFITSLRNVLPKAGEVFNIPLLVPTASGSGSYRLMQLSNYEEKTITVAIDVTNVYVMGYLVNTTSYFFNEPAAATASKFVFRNAAKSVTLPYSGNYEKLQTAADKKRENIPLGLPALSSAISTLYHYDAKAAAAALLVIIQTTAEASRFKYIEQQIVERLRVDEVPSRATISLENNWSALSKQIQLAQTNNGTFIAPVMLIDNTGQRVQISNVSSNVVAKNIMLLLNKQNIAAFEV